MAVVALESMNIIRILSGGTAIRRSVRRPVRRSIRHAVLTLVTLVCRTAAIRLIVRLIGLH